MATENMYKRTASSTRATKGQNYRRAMLAKIHIGKKERGMAEEEYRAMLQERYGKASSSKLTFEEMKDLVSFLEHLGVQYPNSRERSLKPRRDFYEIPDGTTHARQKRYIAALWDALGWKMSGLDVRAKSQWGVESFLWLNDQAALQTLMKDLINRCHRKGIDPENAVSQS